MHPLTFVLLGFAPGFFWLGMVVRSNRQRPDPVALVLRTFLLGAVVALPIGFVGQVVGGEVSIRPGMSASEAAFVAFVLAGLIEELGKFLVVRLSLYDSPYFDEPLRGMVYSGAVALGFASLENVLYMVGHGSEVLGVRALTATLGHVFFSALWGYGLGADRRAKLRGEPSRGYAFLGLLGALAAHGLYDFGLFTDDFGLAIVVFVVCGAASVRLLVVANRKSMHAGRTAAPFVECAKCRAPSAVRARFCSACGVAHVRGLERRCGGCKAPLVANPAYCPGCGVRVAS
ncbi:PrsW family glutamic-type intramembrane protease [Nannocystis pusilla]|uniref:PrsW family intramembrane metalloprotease n=1 Tax=Nannocystis pusilla TaxID=889268 RepID=A0ABS7TKC4_9BACT|nr:PrsW family intramembrane metalloprotease [Nannocystis pusilla]